MKKTSVIDQAAATLLNTANARWAALQRLDTSVPLRAELAELGVPKHTIDALYPFAFGDIALALVPFLDDEGLKRFRMAPNLDGMVNKLTTLRWMLPTKLKPLVALTPDEEEFQATLLPVYERLFESLRVSAHSKFISDSFARSASVILKHACVLMEHVDECSTTEAEVRRFFLLVTNRLLPDLENRVLGLAA